MPAFFEAVIFDMDNTLINSGDKLGADVRDALARLGTIITLEEAKTAKDWVALAQSHGHQPANFWNSFNKRDTWTQSIQKGIATVFPETFTVLDALQKNGYKLILVSRSEETETMEKINCFGFQKYFTKPYLVSPKKKRDTRSKSKTLGYLDAVDKEGLLSEFVSAAQTLQGTARLFIIGDREEDVWAGQAFKRMATKTQYKSAEIITILVHRQGAPPKTRADWTVKDLNEALTIIMSYRRK